MGVVSTQRTVILANVMKDSKISESEVDSDVKVSVFLFGIDLTSKILCINFKSNMNLKIT